MKYSKVMSEPLFGQTMYGTSCTLITSLFYVKSLFSCILVYFTVFNVLKLYVYKSLGPYFTWTKWSLVNVLLYSYFSMEYP